MDVHVNVSYTAASQPFVRPSNRPASQLSARDLVPKTTIANWIAQYRDEFPWGDIGAALVVTVMLLPQGMAYASLANLPPVYGLYACTVPLMAYALFGTSHVLAVGPVALVSLFVAAALEPLATPGTARYEELSLTLAALSGLVMLLMGVLRAGDLVNFLSKPVLKGFMNAAAVIIALSPVPKFLGITTVEKHTSVPVFLYRILAALGDTHLETTLLGLLSLAVLLAHRHVKRNKRIAFPGAQRLRRVPAPLIVVVLGVLLTYLLRLDRSGVSVVGDIPRGLPAVTSPFGASFMDDVSTLLPSAIMVSVIGFIGTISVAKGFASQGKYPLDSNQELIGLGVVNLLCACFSGMCVSGGLSRTAVNQSSGARTPLSGTWVGVLMLGVLLVMTPLFYYLPDTVLSSIIMVACLALLDVQHAKFLYRVRRADFYVFMAALLLTLGFGIETGIFLSAALSLLRIIKRMSKPNWARLGRLPGKAVYRDVLRFPDVELVDGVEVLRFDAGLSFVNIAFFQDLLEDLYLSKPDGGLRAIVLEMTCVPNIDSTALEALHALHELFVVQRKVELFLATVRGPVRDVFAKHGTTALFGTDHFFLELHEAVEHARSAVAAAAGAPAPADQVGDEQL